MTLAVVSSVLSRDEEVPGRLRARDSLSSDARDSLLGVCNLSLGRRISVTNWALGSVQVSVQ